MSAGEPAPPSRLFLEHLPLLREAATRGPLLDLACGRGRHALAAGRAGLTTVALDRNAELLAGLAARARAESLPVAPLRFDLETGTPPPLRPASCGAVLVFRYLHRPLCDDIAGLLSPGGVLLYETFTLAQARLGTGPRRAEFLLEEGELPRLFPGLETSRYDEGPDEDAMTARLVARQAG